MKCWKCGQKIDDSISNCLYCGADLRRINPVTKIGRAMRSLYDYYGAETILAPEGHLEKRIEDLTDVSNAERNNLRAVIEAGAGRLYLNQLQSTDGPDEAFDTRMRSLMTRQGGLSEHDARIMSGYFDEMIGWTPFVQEPSSGYEAVDITNPAPAAEESVPAAEAKPEKRLRKITFPDENADVTKNDKIKIKLKKRKQDHKINNIVPIIGFVIIAVIVLTCVLINHRNAQKRLNQQQTETAISFSIIATQDWLSTEASAETQQAMEEESTLDALIYAQAGTSEAIQSTQTSVVQTQEILNIQSTQAETERNGIMSSDNSMESTETPPSTHIQIHTTPTTPELLYGEETETENYMNSDEIDEAFEIPYQEQNDTMATELLSFMQPSRHPQRGINDPFFIHR